MELLNKVLPNRSRAQRQAMRFAPARASVLHPLPLFVLAAAVLLAALPLKGALIPEPSTTFYGRIFDLTTGQPYQMNEGNLTWIITRSDGVNQVLHTKLFPLNNGEFSYQLDVPHQALSLGLNAGSGAVPLRAASDAHSHMVIAVNGRTARILGPSSSAFDAAQAQRTATYRLDLAVNLNGADTDGNGIPDWWELKHRITNANGDPDGDGRNNLAEFQNGTDPNRDDRVPSLETKEVRAYADGTTVVRLRANDADSVASNLVYTILTAPEAGTLTLRNAVAGSTVKDLTLAAGDEFTQANIASGRVVYTHPLNAEAEGTSFVIRLRDEDPAHSASTNRVAVLLYRPMRDVSPSAIAPAMAGFPTGLPAVAGFPSTEQSFIGSYLLSREMGYVISDSSAEARNLNLAVPSSALSLAEYTTQYVPSFGPDKSHVLLGGQGNDRMAGSMESDILIGGPGNDTLRGNSGSDVFLLTSKSDGNDTIEDFNTSDHDVIDISRVLNGASVSLSDYLQVTSTGSNSALRINFAGTGGSFSDMVLTLSGVQITQNDLYALTDNGNLVTGGKVLPARITIAASQPNASENGPTAGEITLTRSGPSASALTVNLLLTGSAANGVDYEFVPSQITFAPGQRTVTIPITPYVDGLTELSEVALVSIQAGSGYTVGTSSTAQVTIADLLPLLTIEALDPRAIKSEQHSGAFLISRGGAVDRSVLARLQIGGNAINGTDYNSISSFLNLSANQAAAIVEITPKAAANLQSGKSVQLTLKPDAAYLLGSAASARVMLVDAMTSFAQWRAQNFPQSTNALAVFAAEDPGNYGIPNLQRYAYGLDARAPDRARLPKALLQNGYLTLNLWRRPDATDINYAVGVSTNLGNWNFSTSSVQEMIPALSPDPNVSAFRALPGTAETPRLFFKVQLNYQP